MTNLRLHNVKINANFHQNCFIDKCAREKLDIIGQKKERKKKVGQ